MSTGRHNIRVHFVIANGVSRKFQRRQNARSNISLAAPAALAEYINCFSNGVFLCVYEILPCELFYFSRRLFLARGYAAWSQTFYPINKLRNVAVKNSHATHVLLIDIDFVPNRGLESAVTDYIDAGFFNDSKKVSMHVHEYAQVHVHAALWPKLQF